jgi:hypothetical protein
MWDEHIGSSDPCVAEQRVQLRGNLFCRRLVGDEIDRVKRRNRFAQRTSVRVASSHPNATSRNTRTPTARGASLPDAA